MTSICTIQKLQRQWKNIKIEKKKSCRNDSHTHTHKFRIISGMAQVLISDVSIFVPKKSSLQMASEANFTVALQLVYQITNTVQNLLVPDEKNFST